MYNRRDLMRLGAAGAALTLPALTGWRVAQAQESDLVFDTCAFVELTEDIETDGGTKAVTYRFYKAIPYVANPVDVTYQSLNVSVPVAIDGVAIDAGNAPILFANSVGGYLPSSVADAEGVGGGGMTGMPEGAMPAGAAPADAGTEVASGGNAMLDQGKVVSNARLGLAAGYVVVEPGARGRTLTDASGTYFGVAPAAIVDLKAAVRYVRYNAGRIPGNTDWIVSSGTSAGGALSALLGASGDSQLYTEELTSFGAAEASDAIFASGDWCPITDLEHADMAYEWNWGSNVQGSGDLVDQAVSAELIDAFGAYQAGLNLAGNSEFGPLTADTYGDYLVKTYLQPAADKYLTALAEADRAAYLADNSFITYADGKTTFTWADFLAHVGARKKGVPAFDGFDLSSGENNLFGAGTVQARHFTNYSLRRATGDNAAEIDADLPQKIVQMNPMHFLAEANPSRARHWWIRVGAKDTDTSLTVVANLAAAIENLGDEVNAAMYWDAGHGANEDAADFIAWIGQTTGYAS